MPALVFNNMYLVSGCQRRARGWPTRTWGDDATFGREQKHGGRREGKARGRDQSQTGWGPKHLPRGRVEIEMGQFLTPVTYLLSTTQCVVYMQVKAKEEENIALQSEMVHAREKHEVIIQWIFGQEFRWLQKCPLGQAQDFFLNSSWKGSCKMPTVHEMVHENQHWVGYISKWWIYDMDIYPFGKLDILIYPEKDLDIGYFYYIKYPFWQLDIGYGYISIENLWIWIWYYIQKKWIWPSVGKLSAILLCYVSNKTDAD